MRSVLRQQYLFDGECVQPHAVKVLDGLLWPVDDRFTAVVDEVFRTTGTPVMASKADHLERTATVALAGLALTAERRAVERLTTDRGLQL